VTGAKKNHEFCVTEAPNYYRYEDGDNIAEAFYAVMSICTTPAALTIDHNVAFL